jgi:FkbM family methyltransferase
MRSEPWLRQWFPLVQACPRGMAWDIGANAGEWTVLLAGMFERVVSLEPDERCQPPAGYVYDRRAAWSETGEETLYRRTSALQTSLLPTHGIGDGGAKVEVVEQVTVQAVTLDDLACEFGRPDFIKLDIEGAEVQALAGATMPCFSRCCWLIESHNVSGEVGTHLLRLGFVTCHVIKHPHPQASPGHEWIFVEP